MDQDGEEKSIHVPWTISYRNHKLWQGISLGFYAIDQYKVEHNCVEGNWYMVFKPFNSIMMTKTHSKMVAVENVKCEIG